MQRIVYSLIVGFFISSLGYSASLNKVKDKLGSKLASKLEKNFQSQPMDVVVYFKKPSIDGFTKASTLEERKALYKTLRSEYSNSSSEVLSLVSNLTLDYTRYPLTHTMVIRNIDVNNLLKVAGSDLVTKVREDVIVRGLIDPVESTEDLLKKVGKATKGVGSNIAATGANDVWESRGAKGRGIVVANQDTGIDWDHPGLKSQYRGFQDGNVDHDYNWHDSIRRNFAAEKSSCGYNSEEPCDDHGHGTHTLGTSVGDDSSGNQVGMAPEAEWIACRNMDAGYGKPSTYIECFEFFLAPYPVGGNPDEDSDPSKAPHVINNSWGCPGNEGCQGDEMIEILESINQAGIMIVAAAGNDGSSCSTIKDQPATISHAVLSVGAYSHSSNRIASFSSRGPSRFDGSIGPSVTAPGVNIRSTTRGGGYAGGGWSGTSMACPHVVGLVALMWSANSDLIGNTAETKRIIESTADATTVSQSCGGVSGSQIPNNTFGHGKINAVKAVEAAMKFGK